MVWMFITTSALPFPGCYSLARALWLIDKAMQAAFCTMQTGMSSDQRHGIEKRLKGFKPSACWVMVASEVEK